MTALKLDGTDDPLQFWGASSSTWRFWPHPVHGGSGENKSQMEDEELPELSYFPPSLVPGSPSGCDTKTRPHQYRGLYYWVLDLDRISAWPSWLSAVNTADYRTSYPMSSS